MLKALFSMDSFRRHVSSVSVYKTMEQANYYAMSKMYTRRSFLVMNGLNRVVKYREGATHNYPLLILNGDKDIELAQRMSERWHKELPLSNFYTIPNAGHCANMDNPDVFNRIVMEFIGERR